MLVDDAFNGLRVDVAQIGVYQDVAEAADLFPVNRGMLVLKLFRQLLGRFGEGLQITQGCIVLRSRPASDRRAIRCA